MRKQNNGKKALLAIVAVILAVCCAAALSAFAYAATVTESGTCGDNLTWTLYSDGKLVIDGTGKMDDYRWYDTRPWDSYQDSITSVEISEGATYIGEYAFCEHTNITSIDLPDSVTDIGSNAFEDCSSLTNIIIPDDLTSIGDDAFCGCSSLISINIPDGVTSIGYSAFQDCSSLANIDIPGGVTSINSYTFDGCSSLTSIDLPDGVTDIGQAAFRECSSLTSIDIPDGVTIISYYTFENCSNLASIDIPGDVTSIESYAFSGCSSLTSIDIPNSVKSIGSYAFCGCSSLVSIDIPDDIKSISNDTFYGCSSLTSIDIPDGMTSIGSYAFRNCSSLTSIDIPDNVLSIGEAAFKGCSSLKSIDIPDGITSISGSTFYDCSSLTSVDIPDGVLSIGESAFRGCLSLESIDIPDGVTNINSSTFEGCSSLTSIDIPDDVTSIGNYAFEDCSNLTAIDIPDGVTDIGSYAFKDCLSLENIDLPCDLTTIGEYIFYNCINLRSIEIPEDVTSIGEYAFYNCYRMKSITFSGDVVSIGRYAFYHCASIKTINIPDSVTVIDEYTFNYCLNLRTIELPSNLESIEYDAFSDCTALEGIVLPDGTKRIENGAFYGCTNMKTFIIPDGVEYIGQHVFSHCKNLLNLTYPESITAIHDDFSGTTLDSITVLNKDCRIYLDDEENWNKTPVIYGYEGSTAQKKASEIYADFRIYCPHENTTDYDATESPCAVVGNTSATKCDDCGEWLTGNGLVELHTDKNTDFVCDRCLSSIGTVVYSGSCGENVNYTVYDDGLTMITGEGALTEPVGYWGVVQRTLVIDDGVTAIGNSAFSFSCFLRVYISGSVETLGENAFYRSEELKHIHFSQGLTNIGRNAFEECYALEEINLPDTVKHIGSSVFSECIKLTELVFPASVENIEDCGLNHCKNLKNITVLNPECKIEHSPLSELITVWGYENSTAQAFAEEEGCLFEIWCNHINTTEYEAADAISCTVPGNTAGTKCNDCGKWLEGNEITLPHTDEDNDYICDVCENDTRYILSSGYCGDGGRFSHNSDYSDITRNVEWTLYSDGTLKFDGEGLMYNGFYEHNNLINPEWLYITDITSVEIGNGITNIGCRLFKNYHRLETISIADSVTVIGDYAFQYCSGIISIDIPNSVTNINQYAFYGCSRLTSIESPDSVTNIDYAAFYDCDMLTEIAILNPSCTIYDSESTIPENTVIKGYKSSTAQTYAEKYDRKFVAIPVVCPHENTTNHEAVTATCTTDGYTAGTYCVDCETWIDGHTVQTASGHTYSPVIKKATLTKNGSVKDTCENCGDVRSATTVYKVTGFALSNGTYTYSGKTKNPTVSVTDYKGKTLVEGTDYTVSFTTDRKSVGVHEVKVTLKGNYSGSKTLNFTVRPKATAEIRVESKTKTLAIEWDKVTGADGYCVYVYKGTKQILAKNTSKLTYTAKELETGTKYKVTVKAYFKVDGEKVYAEKTTSVETATKPAKVTLSSVTAGTKQAKLSWKATECTSYQIRYSTDKDFGKYETVTVKGADSVSKTIKSLKSGKTYYFKVRAYKSVDGVKYYGSFSSVKSVKVK